MKQNLHPTWFHDAVVTCACGSTFITGSSSKTLQVDICSACHPFFTGEMKFVDTQGRVDKFMQKMQNAQALQQTKKTKKKAEPVVEESQDEPRSYKQILQEQQTVLKKAA